MKRASKPRKVFRIVLISLLLIAIGSAVIFGLIRHYELAPIRSGEFSPELWDKYPKHRHYMVEDMEVEIDIWNLSKSEIISILGTNAVGIYEPGGLRYIIGRGFAFNEYYSIIFTDDNEQVINIMRFFDL